MKHAITKILALILTLVLTLYLAACSDKQAKDSSSTPPQSSSTPSPTLTTAELPLPEVTVSEVVETEPLSVVDEFLADMQKQLDAGNYTSVIENITLALATGDIDVSVFENISALSPEIYDKVIFATNMFKNENDYKAGLETLKNGRDFFALLAQYGTGFQFDNYYQSLNVLENDLASQVVSIAFVEAQQAIGKGDYTEASSILARWASVLDAEQGKALREMNNVYSRKDILEKMMKYANRAFVKKCYLGDSFYGIIKDDGSLWTCGKNNYGQLGDGTVQDRTEPVKVMEKVVSVSSASSDETAYALKADGSLWSWGEANYGSLRDGTETHRSEPKKILDDVIFFDNHYYIKSNGDLFLIYNTKHTKIDSNVIFVHSDSNAYITEDGVLWALNANLDALHKYVILNDPLPKRIMEDVKFVTMKYALKNDGTLWSWSLDTFGEQVAENIVAVKGNHFYTYALDTSGVLYIENTGAWYKNNYLQAITDNVNSLNDYCDGYRCLYNTNNGEFCYAKENGYVEHIASGVKVNDSIEPYLKYTHSVKEGITLTIAEHTIFVDVAMVGATKTDGSLLTWGSNEKGYLGDGNGKYYHSECSVRKDGSLWINDKTKIDDDVISFNSISDSVLYVKKGGAIYSYINREKALITDNVKAIVVAWNGRTGAYIDTDGNLWTWGAGGDGEIGNNFNLSVDFEHRYNVLANVVDAAIGSNFVIALKKDGSLWGWGNNSSSQLGDGTIKNSLTPIKIMDGVKIP